MRRVKSVGLVWVVVGSVVAALAEAGGEQRELAEVELAPDGIRQLMQDGDYAAAVQAIERSLQREGAARDYLTYLKGRALYFQGQYDGAVAVFEQLRRQFPQSRWWRRGRFAAGVALAAKGDYRAAERIYREQALSLLAQERRDELASICTELAEAYFGRAEQGQKPDYKKALQFYLKALELGPGLDLRVKVELRVARCRQQLEELAEAAQLYERLMEEHPESQQAIEAGFRLGQCLLGQDEPRQARRVWQDLLAAHADSPSKWLAEAAFRLAATWGIAEPGSDRALNLGVAALESFLARFPTHRLAARAHLDIARSYMHRGRHQDAVGWLQKLLGDKRYQGRKEIAQARNLLGQAYRAQRKFTDALAAWHEYLTKHPAHEAWSTVQRQVTDTEYQMGLAEYKARQYEPARRTLAEFLARHPLDSRCPGILFLFGQMNYEQKRWQAAIADWRRLVSKYPRTEESSYAQYMIGVATERGLGKPAEALKEYRKVTWGSHIFEASEAADRLTAKALSVVTERVFRSDETPALKLTTRNIASVTVRVYKLDMESYFRKMHAAGGVEELDITLIEPARTLELKIPGYEQYKEIETLVPVPLPDGAKSGAIAVTVSSDTLEATSLVIQSDLDIIVKASRDEVFVFAENMRLGKPWPGARVLISDGQQIVASGATGDDGVFQGAAGQLRQADDVRVLVQADGHVASNVVGLKGVGIARGLADKGYIYTDRPVYRPGQRVYVRGCIRRAKADAYVIDEGKAYTLLVLDPRGRAVWRRPVRLGRFGTFHADLPLPATCPPGQYRVQVSDGAGHHFQGSFEVREYKLEPVRLVIESPRRVYYRGETIEGTIRAQYYYGAPLAGRQISYQLADGRTHTARADGSGRVHFKLPTREFSESQVLPLKAILAERNVHAAVNFYLAAQGFSVELSTARDVFLAGESFEVTARTRDAAGKPVGRKLRLQVLELTVTDGRVGERLVREQALETAAADGTARTSLRLEHGGRFRLRATGLDRLGNHVSGQIDLLISGDSDAVRLRILAGRHTYQVGEQASVVVHWRERPALALVTFQGAEVLGYRLVRLETGANELPVVMESKLAPNFDLAVAVMTEVRPPAKGAQGGPAMPRRFHEASSPFTVQRALHVSLSCQPLAGGGRQPLRPGQPLQVTLKTTDAQGKPVPAEVSLAMIDQALLERFRWPVPAIQQFFSLVRREPAVRTGSSIEFAYRPQTRPIAAALLSERARAELARREAASRRRGLGPGGGGAGLGGLGGGGLGGGFGAAAGAPGVGPVEQVPADFDGLIEVIEGTAGTETWEQTAGPPPAQKPAAPAGREAKGGGPALTPPPPPEPALAETAYWHPAIVTGQDGKATVTLQVPERTGAWTLLAKGITGQTLAGETSSRVVVSKPLFGQLKLPGAFTEGDEAEVVAVVHNDAVDGGKIDVKLATQIGQRRVEEKKQLSVTSKGIQQLRFKVPLRPPERETKGKQVAAAQPTEVAFELTVAAGGVKDVLRRTVPLHPYGLTVYSTAGGTAEANATVWVEPPPAFSLRSPRLQVLVGPTVERSLLDVVLAPSRRPCQPDVLPAGSDVATAASDLMACIGLQKLLAVGADTDGPQAQALDIRARAAIGALSSAQNKHGGWGWSSGAASDPYTTARVVWALSLARKAGYVVPDGAFQKALHYLDVQIAGTVNSDYASKAVLLHALSVAGQGRFELANRLYRERLSLSAAAALYLALSLIEMDRPQMAEPLLAMVAERKLIGSEQAAADPAGPCNVSPVELRAVYALALEAVSPQSPAARQMVDWLLAHRTGYRWRPAEATGPASLALCQWFAASRFEGERYRLTVWVNDRQVAVLELDGARPSKVIDVPGELLAKGKQRVAFEINGRGRYTYLVTLAGFVPADELKSTTSDWQVERVYRPAPLEREGREIARGFAIVQGPVAAFRNPLTQLPVGRRGVVELTLRRNSPEAKTRPQLEYLVVTDPLPSGAAVIEQSVRGPFERFQILPGRIIFYVGNRPKLGTIRYELYGYLPGRFRAAPAVVRDAHRPGRLAVSQPKLLTVLPAGAQSSDPYRLTPQELYELGRLAFQHGDMGRAQSLLTELVTKWRLQPKVFKHVVTMLLDAHLAQDNPAQAVRFFEIIRERWPQQMVPFDKIVKLGDAYDRIGEYERSYLVFRATVESHFRLESSVAAFLASEGRFLGSVALMQRLLRQYPPEAYLAAAQYGLAQQVYAKGPEAAKDPELRRAEMNRADLTRQSWRMLQAFLTDYPQDPAADQAAFSAATALLDLHKYQQAAAACQRYARRYPKSKLLDSFWYLIGYSRFAMGQFQSAGQVLRRVAESRPPDKAAGQQRPSPNKWPAIYLLGQVHHSLGQAAEAVRYYRLVQDRFPDAKKSIQYFLRRALRLPELTGVRPGQPVRLTLHFRNVADCEVKVYRIDLMKFALVHRDFGRVAQINLAGIQPQQTMSVKLGTGRDYRDRTHLIPLELKQQGAYLVVCRGADLFASGLVLVSSLGLEVQHDAAAQEVRVTVKDAVADRYLNGVQVKVVGSRNVDFVSGTTDRRGLFVAEGIVGAPTVIAQAGPGRYAFFRSPTVAGRGPLPPQLLARLQALSAAAPTAPSAQPGPGAVAKAPRRSTGIVVSGPGDSPVEQKIEAMLDLPTSLNLEKATLQQVAEAIENRHAIPVHLDWSELEDEGITRQTPVTFRGRGLPLRSALNQMLGPLNAAWVVENDSLTLTSLPAVEQELATVIYPVGDIVRFRDPSGEQWTDFETLIYMVQNTVEPDTWSCVGGPGTIEEMSYGNIDVLVISQTPRVQRQVARLLEKLRSVPGFAGKEGRPPVKERPADWGMLPAHEFSGPGRPTGAGRGGRQELLKGVRELQQRLLRRQLERLQRGGGLGGGLGGFGVTAGSTQ